ncbi:MAG: site-specific integrase [Bacteroidetes bacterium]|nr:site-specific integrase [Bacteroidota bacterium]
MSVILRTRVKKNGEKTLRLEIYHNHKRRYETLSNMVLLKESNPKNRELNKDTMRQAEKIRVQYAAQLDANDYNVTYESGRKTIVLDWFQSFIDKYTKTDKRNLSGALNKFKVYLDQKNKLHLTFSDLNAPIIEGFMEYLEKTGTGEGPISYYNRFKKVIKHAIRSKLLKENIFLFVEKKMRGKAKMKDILLIEEIELLAKTPIKNVEVKNAFIFSAITGLRWCDVKILKWDNIDLKTQYLNISQSKTNQIVSIDLNEIAIKILEISKKDGEFVFKLPTANGANKIIKAWVKRAGINKNITWHNARHSFGTNLVLMDTNIFKTSKLLGHTTLKHTQRYIHLASILKERTTDKLNFNFS